MYGVGLGGLDGAAWPSKTVGPDGRRTWFHWPGFGQQRARRRSHTSPRWRCLRPVTTGSRSLRQPLHSVTSPATLAHNNSFKPNALRYTNNMADKACHVVGSTKHVGLPQELRPTRSVHGSRSLQKRWRDHKCRRPHVMERGGLHQRG